MTFQAERKAPPVRIRAQSPSVSRELRQIQEYPDKNCHHTYKFLANALFSACRERSWPEATLLNPKGL
jgi:hypothetical protein